MTVLSNIGIKVEILLVVSISLAGYSTTQAGEWGIGMVGGWYDSPVDTVSREEGVIPFISYEGERVSVDFQQVSYRLLQYDDFELKTLARIRFQGADYSSSTLQGMQDRKPSLDVGFSASMGSEWGILTTAVVTDAIGKHEGHEVIASYSVPIQLERLVIVPTVGVKWLSRNLVDYYYGVRSNEARPGRPTYQGLATYNTFSELSVTYLLTPHWSLLAGASVTHLGNNIRNSPIIKRDYESGGYLGFMYAF